MADRGSTYRVFRPEIWSDFVKFFFEDNLVCAKHFQNFSDDVTAGGEAITIPQIAELAAPSNITTTTGVITENVISDTRTTLTLNTWKANALRFTDYQMAQIASKYNLQEKYAQAIAYSLSKTFDSALLTQGQNTTRRVSDSRTSISMTNLRDAMAVMDSYSVPHDGLLLILDAAVYWDLLRTSELRDAHFFGRGAPQATGAVDMIFGIPTVVTSNIPTYGVGAKANLLIHKQAIVYAIGNLPGGSLSGPRLQLKGPSTEGLYSKLVGDIMYGTALQDGLAGIKIVTRVGA